VNRKSAVAIMLFTASCLEPRLDEATGTSPEQSTVVEELATNQAIAACASVCDKYSPRCPS
jgi:hypothetical protein